MRILDCNIFLFCFWLFSFPPWRWSSLICFIDDVRDFLFVLGISGMERNIPWAWLEFVLVCVEGWDGIGSLNEMMILFSKYFLLDLERILQWMGWDGMALYDFFLFLVLFLYSLFMKPGPGRGAGVVTFMS